MLELTLLFLVSLIPLSLTQTSPQPFPYFRWSGQVAVANSPSGGNSSSIYYYGGEISTSPGINVWTNALLALNLATSFNTGSPPITVIKPDSGNQLSPPAVALGALWPSSDGSLLYQYGGEFSDNGNVTPPPNAIWQYSIASGNWSTVQTTGDNIVRVAEGSAAISTGSSGSVGYYFSGHEDSHTGDLSDQIPRIYLSSMVTFDLTTHAVKNISSYAADGSSSSNSTPQVNLPVYRADGSLTFVPGLGTGGKGILVAIGGATASQYIDNSVLDVYDIGSGGWTKQATLGDTIGSRVNHCAVLASTTVNGAPSYDIFIYGGQLLSQSNRDSAIYILTLPSYTWTFVGNSLPSQPLGRAGHTCTLSGSQMVIIGGLVSSSIISDNPGIYVYDVSQSKWQNSFTAGTVYRTPSILANVTGSSSSVPAPLSSSSSNTSSTSSSASQVSSGDPHSKSVDIGAIVGGVVGGLIALIALLALLFICFKRDRRAKEAEKNAIIDNRRDGAARTNSSSSEEGSNVLEKSRPNSEPSWRNSRHSGSNEQYFSSPHASDDVEDATSNMELSFGSHLVPKQPLRVMNPEREEEEIA